MKTASEVRAQARESLKGFSWGLVTLVYMLASSIASYIPIVGPFASMPLGYSFNIILLKRSRGEEQKVDNLFDGFRDGVDNILRRILVVLVPQIFIILWMFLLIVPGYVKAYAYSMTIFISHDNPDLGVMECITKSREIMNGNKLRLLWLDLTFFGWALSCLFFFPVFYVLPYWWMARAHFYDTLVNQDNRVQDVLDEPEDDEELDRIINGGI